MPELLPEELRSEHIPRFLANEYPIEQTNPVTGYRTSLYRSGGDADFLGWIELVNSGETAGYIIIRRPVASPYLSGSPRYVVMDVPPDLLDPLLRILQSGEPLQIRYSKASENANGSAFLEHRE